MPEQELEALLTAGPTDRRFAQAILAAAFLLIMGPLIFIGVHAAGADHRADRASKSACTLVGVVARQTTIIDSALGVLLTPPGPDRDAAVAALRRQVDDDKRAAAQVSRANRCA